MTNKIYIKLENHDPDDIFYTYGIISVGQKVSAYYDNEPYRDGCVVGTIEEILTEDEF